MVGPKDGRLYFQTKDGKLMDMATVNNRAADLPKNFDMIVGTKGFTDSIDSAEQNLFIAKGKSAETASITVSDKVEALSLKIFVDF